MHRKFDCCFAVDADKTEFADKTEPVQTDAHKHCHHRSVISQECDVRAVV